MPSWPSPAPTRSTCAPRCRPGARACRRWPTSRWPPASGCPSCSRGTRPTCRRPARSTPSGPSPRPRRGGRTGRPSARPPARSATPCCARSSRSRRSPTSPPAGWWRPRPPRCPRAIGGVRNWDYRYCWLRDATFSLYALMLAGYEAEAVAWRDWLLRAAAGAPDQLQIMYGPAGERRLTELTLDWLPGYEGSTPVRVGNAASGQFQLDVYGEVMDCLHQARQGGAADDRLGVGPAAGADGVPRGALARAGRGHLGGAGPAAALHPLEGDGLGGRRPGGAGRRGVRPRRARVDAWRRLRADIHDEVCRQGYDAEQGAFVQSFGRPELDASLLMVPLVGFLPATDERVIGHRGGHPAASCAPTGSCCATPGTATARSTASPAARAPSCPARSGWPTTSSCRGARPRGRPCSTGSPGWPTTSGLLSEEYDPVGQRLVGNFPQAFTHVALVNTAHNLASPAGPARSRSGTAAAPPG